MTFPNAYHRARDDEGKLKPLPSGVSKITGGSGYAHHYWIVESDHNIDMEEASLIAHILDGGYLFGSRVEKLSEIRYKIVGYID